MNAPNPMWFSYNVIEHCINFDINHHYSLKYTQIIINDCSWNTTWVNLNTLEATNTMAYKPRSHSDDNFCWCSRCSCSFMIMRVLSDRGLLFPISGTICCPWPPVQSEYHGCTNKARHLYDWSVWPTLCTFSTTISMTTGTIDMIAFAMLTISLMLSPICCHD